MLPVVVRSTEEMLRLVPDSLRQASAALGTPRWKTTTKVVLPAAMPGITSGAMLAIARAAGEGPTPILFTVGMVSSTNFFRAEHHVVGTDLSQRDAARR